MFSTKTRAVVRKLSKQNFDKGILETYLFAKGKGHPLHYFPSEIEEALEFVPRNSIFDEKVPTEWINAWIKLWPTLGELSRHGIKLPYAISGHAPDVKKRMPVFIKEFCERMGISEDDCEFDYKLDVIWKATVAYLSHLEQTNYEYAKKNHKFIKDTGGSILEEWCHRILAGDVEDTSTFRV